MIYSAGTEDKYACHNVAMIKAVYTEHMRRKGTMSEAYEACVRQFPDSMLAK